MKVILCKRIDGGEKRGDVFLERELELGFAPPIGTTFLDGSMDHMVTELLYDVSRGALEAWTFPDDTLLREGPDSLTTLETRVEIWEADGYVVSEHVT